MSLLLAIYAGAFALVSAAIAVTRPNAVHALLYLVVTLLALAVAFFALGAAFAAVLLIMIYAGAIVVLFVFVVMTLPISPESMTRERASLRGAWPVPLLLSVLIIAPFVFGEFGIAANTAAAPVSAQQVGRLLFGPWALAVELASLLLLAGLIGVRHIGRSDRTPRSRP
ncbi:NADH-quinone oxidoreductase subunit J family protein [Rhodopseudomonas pseudopalustris]|uniref:NADH-quinone oxidoreductase subunit J n=2 Tax=Rhodopseudomonas TaxID=1073 RepID=Q13BG7_RHOPS|nr:NADH-quinone oxidoreductase subunit J [Rhodopseudomonas pseudopalustris]ABE38572.1 NADH-ubiquinone/plastoquinone oxidoreductase, chain 6 [Rhodopseudomonas palustris BisB5]SEO35208.1 NADH dehydrogenase subunit J [Rhodopseudomonas pseudopalustris]